MVLSNFLFYQIKKLTPFFIRYIVLQELYQG